ncbi:hypothetical protein BAUCODRAFT_235264 [Baudoinia panamericana UAMH 10762]|uniref:DUF6604 domain-containing protein n=1 Tax=Baudoinia panamericana (strain UAMH 10762) TaxID=717646 RepID=M2MP99_BAUPA|nr:uncharacterized protein BAUCODRAFT_235264 [Baudoinia panamericana UAMH 10762]EMC93298.1 hypothetical protein BAUCODRAFT_235264 [Baudoinia panamericana UAMH 10762]
MAAPSPSIPHIAGRYALYKEGTARIAEWIKATSRSCGALTRSSSPQKLTTGDLTRYANAIACTLPAVNIPGSIIEDLREVISSRQVCAEWYTAQQTTQTKDRDVDIASHRSHRHFIDVLQGVLDVLQEARKRKQRVRGARGGNSASPEKRPATANGATSARFAQLELHEPSEDQLITETPTGFVDSSAASTVIAETLNVDAFAEQQYALWCFLTDCSDIRAIIRQTWQDFETGHLSFCAASMTTDVAFGIMRRADDELSSLYPEFGDADEVLELLDADLYLFHDSPRYLTHRMNTSETPLTTLDMLLCPQAHHLLWASVVYQQHISRPEDEGDSLHQRPKRAGRKLVKPRAAETTRTAHHLAQLKDPRIVTNESQFCPIEIAAYASYHPFAKKLVSIFPEMLRHLKTSHHSSLKADVLDVNNFDEFLRGMQELSGGLRRRMWLTFACQTFMDNYDITSKRPNIGLYELQRAVARLDAIDASHTRKFTTLSTIMASSQLLVERCRFTCLRMSCPVKSDENFSFGSDCDWLDGSTTWWPTTVYGTLPTLIGTTINTLQLHAVSTGIWISNLKYGALAMAHLYSAMRHYRLLDVEWTDMDCFIERQNSHCAFIDKLDETVGSAAVARRFCIAVGAPTTLATHRCNSDTFFKQASAGRKSSIRLLPGSKLLRPLFDRISIDNAAGFSRGELLDVVLRGLCDVSQGSTSSAYSRLRSSNSPRSAQVTGSQLLLTFRDAFIESEPELYVDHASLWNRCIDLFAEMRVAQHPFPETVARLMDGHPWFATMDLLYEAQLCSDLQLPVEQSSLGRVARYLRSYIVVHGNDFTAAAGRLTSGHISRHLHPMLSPEAYDEVLEPPDASQYANTMEKIRNLYDILELNTPNPLTGASMEAERSDDMQLPPEIQGDVKAVYAARKKSGGRRLLRSRK